MFQVQVTHHGNGGDVNFQHEAADVIGHAKSKRMPTTSIESRIDGVHVSTYFFTYMHVLSAKFHDVLSLMLDVLGVNSGMF